MNNFVVYNASAGSGKTTILSIEYIALTLQNPDKFKRILAVTFTNKAASEMKERIISYLKSLANWELKNNGPLKQNLGYIKQRTGLDEDTIKQRAEKTLQNILHSYSDFAIKTIDSFIHRIVRTFAYDLHLPIDFDIETDSDKLLSQAVDILISKAGIENDLTDALVEFAEEKTNDSRSWHIENDLLEFSKVLLDEEGQINTAKLKELSIKDFETIRSNVQKFIKYFEDYLLRIVNPIFDKIEELDLKIEHFAGGRTGVVKFLEYVKEKRFDKLEPTNRVKQNMEQDKWYSSKAKADEKAKIDSINGSIRLAYDKIIEFSQKNKSKYYVLELVYQKLYPLAVLNETDKIINDIKSQNNLMHISDFNKKVSQIVLSEPIPFIYERVGEKFEHFFIDEFQDTSVMQWQNMLPLIDNSLASGNYNMIVGDGKQAIYRWRNGNVEQFINLPNIEGQSDNDVISERAATIQRNFKKVELDMNFRSRKEIVEFNNDIFDYISQTLPEKYKQIYQGLSQKTQKNEGGLISIEFIDEANNEDYLRQTFEKIEELVIKLQGKYQLRDIGILCRSNKQANIIAEYLLPKGIDVVSNESLLLCNSGKVNFIIALLQIIADPSKTTYIAYAINFLAEDNSGEMFDGYLKRMTSELNNASYLEILNFLLSQINEDEISEELHYLPVYDLCERLARAFNIHEDSDPFIAFLLETVWDFTVKNTSGLNPFLTWWEENKHKIFITVPQGLNAVNIMTIHKSKGLQFPVVIFPFADERLKSTKTNLWIESNYEELGSIHNPIVRTKNTLEETEYASNYIEERERSLLDLVNILYVSLTRPEEQLHVMCEMPASKESSSVPYYLKSYLESIDMWEKDKKRYELGKEDLNKEFNQTEAASKANVYNELISTSWQNKIKISRNAEKKWNLDAPETNIQKGKTMHSILALIDTREDVESSIHHAVKKGWINENQVQPIKKKLLSILEKPLIEKFFMKNVKSVKEREILTANGKLYRPDRVVFDKDEVIVIDFKTGQEEKVHKKQINLYSDLLFEMGYEEIRKYLLYIDEEKLIEC